MPQQAGPPGGNQSSSGQTAGHCVYVSFEAVHGMCQRFCTALDCVDIGFIPGGTLDQLPLPAQLGASRVGGIDVNKPRLRAGGGARPPPRLPTGSPWPI